MCLFPLLIKNQKYLPNKKNNGRPPIAKDFRTEYVPVGCGNCIECRKQKANAWRIRLCEEIKNNKHAYFVTLTFSNESLKKLMQETNEKECNAVAGIAVRRFLERWRKKYKKSIRHWLITELGHENTERIHLHGILLHENEITQEELNNIWQYGFADTGQYCNVKTINYIVKYVTKIDHDHKGYKPQIFCSAGLGANYINDFTKDVHKYRPRNTKETYTLNNGAEVNLPIYYRNKFYNEEQREQLWLEKLDKRRIYVRGAEIKRIDTINGHKLYMHTLRNMQEENKNLGYGNRSEEWKEKDYNITLKMLNKSQKMLESTKK